MRKLFIVFFLFWIGVTRFVSAQDNILEQKISVDYDHIQITEALADITNQTGIAFSYSQEKTPLNSVISIHMKAKKIHELLDEMFRYLSIEYVEVEGKIILRKGKPPEHFTISGHIKDQSDGETIIGGTIFVHELLSGCISNTYGFYSISLPEGKYQIRYSNVGYTDIQHSLTLNKNIVINKSLLPSTDQLEEIIITPQDSVLLLESIQDNAHPIDQLSVLQKTAPMGEADVIKSLDMIPGVQLFRDGSTFFNVRGGDRDQNQILVDEAPIYNPAHFLGLFSSIMPESVKDMKMYKGDLPARMGGRLSSVLDIQTRDGNLKRFSTYGSLGLISGRLAIEGPIIKDKSSFFISGRRSYIQSIIKNADPTLSSLFFSDFTAKTNLKVNDKNRLFLSTYSGKDEFIADGGIKWENKAGTIRWNHIYSNKLFSNTTLYSSKYEYALINSPYLTWKNHISNVSLKTDFIYYKDLKKTLNFGFKWSGHNFNPGNAEDSLGNIPENLSFVPKRNATEISVYFSEDRTLSQKLLLTWGLRLSTWTNYGRTIEYEFDESYHVVDSTIYDTRKSYNSYANLQPRLSITYLANSNNFLKFNYTRAAQYINLISNSISPFNNLEVWMPASINIQPQLSDQISLGWFRTGANWQWQVEGYYKSLQHQIDYTNQAKLLLNPYLEGEIRAGKGTAYGVEWMLSKTTGKLTGWISYTLSRSFREIEGINEGKKYPSLWDKPSQFSLFGNFKASKRFNLSGTLYLSTGAPISTPTSFYQFSGRTVPIYGEKNNDRLPGYNRFDISANFQLNKTQGKFNHSLMLSIFNFYGQKNVILENYNKTITSDGNYIVPSDISEPISIVPTKIFVYSILPSITYSFKI